MNVKGAEIRCAQVRNNKQMKMYKSKVLSQ